MSTACRTTDLSPNDRSFSENTSFSSFFWFEFWRLNYFVFLETAGGNSGLGNKMVQLVALVALLPIHMVQAPRSPPSLLVASEFWIWCIVAILLCPFWWRANRRNIYPSIHPPYTWCYVCVVLSLLWILLCIIINVTLSYSSLFIPLFILHYLGEPIYWLRHHFSPETGADLMIEAFELSASPRR